MSQSSGGDDPKKFSHFRRSQGITQKKSFDVSRPPKETQDERREKIFKATDSRISHSNRSNVKASPLDVSRQSLKEIQEEREEKTLNVSSTPDIIKQLSKRNEMRDKTAEAAEKRREAEAAEKRRDNESKDEAIRQITLQQSRNNRLEAKEKTEQDAPPQVNRIGNIEHVEEALNNDKTIYTYWNRKDSSIFFTNDLRKVDEELGKGIAKLEIQQSLADNSNIQRIAPEDGLNKVERFDLGYKVDIAPERIDQTRNPQIDETHPVQTPNDTRPTQVPNDIHSIQASNDTQPIQTPNDVHLFPVPNDPPPSYNQIDEAHPVPIPKDELPRYEQIYEDTPPSYYQVYQEARHQEFIDSRVALRVALQEYQAWAIEQRRREINTVPDRQNPAAVDIPKPLQETQESTPEAQSETNPVHSEHSHIPDIDDGGATSYEEDSIFPEINKKKKKELSLFPEKSKKSLFDLPTITDENKKRQTTQETERIRQEKAYEAQEKYFQDKKIQEYNALCEAQAIMVPENWTG
ncbi:MAG TPA: hypothetical protein VGL94_10175 [Ktedonobacteraceae bacterium]|jgi:hypothetical protein